MSVYGSVAQLAPPSPDRKTADMSVVAMRTWLSVGWNDGAKNAPPPVIPTGCHSVGGAPAALWVHIEAHTVAAAHASAALRHSILYALSAAQIEILHHL